MLSAIGLLVGVVVFILMVVKGFDMLTSTLAAAVIILLTSGLDIVDGLFTTFAEGAGGFVAQWLIILAFGGIFGELVGETGLAVRIAKTLSKALGNDRVGLVMLICVFLITLLGVNGYIMVFVLYPVADSMMKEAKMDRRLLPMIMLGGGACAIVFAYCMDPAAIIPTSFLGTTTGVAPGLSFIFSAITCVWFVVYFNYAQKRSKEKYSEEELLALYKDEHEIPSDDELPGFAMSIIPFILVLIVVVALSNLTELDSYPVLAAGLLVGIMFISVTQFNSVKSKLKGIIKKGSSSGLNTMLTVAAVVGLSKVLAISPAFTSLQTVIVNVSLPIYFKTWIGTLICALLTGSSLTGETLFLQSFGETFVAQGANAAALHRVCIASAMAGNKLPNASVVVMETEICKCTIAESYKHVVLGTIVPCLVASFVVTLLATFGIIF